MNNVKENEGTWVNPSVREENNVIHMEHTKKFYMATLHGTTLETDVSLPYLLKRYRDKPRVTLWECVRGLPRRVVRNGTSHY